MLLPAADWCWPCLEAITICICFVDQQAGTLHPVALHQGALMGRMQKEAPTLPQDQWRPCRAASTDSSDTGTDFRLQVIACALPICARDPQTLLFAVGAESDAMTSVHYSPAPGSHVRLQHSNQQHLQSAKGASHLPCFTVHRCRPCRFTALLTSQQIRPCRWGGIACTGSLLRLHACAGGATESSTAIINMAQTCCCSNAAQDRLPCLKPIMPCRMGAPLCTWQPYQAASRCWPC